MDKMNEQNGVKFMMQVLTDKHHVLTKTHQWIMMMYVRETERKYK